MSACLPLCACVRVCVYLRAISVKTCVYHTNCVCFHLNTVYSTLSTLLVFFVPHSILSLCATARSLLFRNDNMLWLPNAPTNSIHTFQHFLNDVAAIDNRVRFICLFPSSESDNIHSKYFEMSRYHSKFRMCFVFIWLKIQFDQFLRRNQLSLFRSENFQIWCYHWLFSPRFRAIAIESTDTLKHTHTHSHVAHIRIHMHTQHQNHYQCDWIHGSVVWSKLSKKKQQKYIHPDEGWTESAFNCVLFLLLRLLLLLFRLVFLVQFVGWCECVAYASVYVTLKFWIHANPSNILTPLCKCVNCCIRQRLLSFCAFTFASIQRQTLAFR